jgi:hypothetical protein
MSTTNPGYGETYTKPAANIKQFKDVTLGAMALQEPDAVAISGGIIAGATLAGAVQNITVAGAISLDANHVKITGPGTSTYAVTLAAPTRGGQIMVIEMVATTASDAVTLALTNVVGGTAGSSASFDAAGEILTLVSASAKWLVLNQFGVTLS